MQNQSNINTYRIERSYKLDLEGLELSEETISQMYQFMDTMVDRGVIKFSNEEVDGKIIFKKEIDETKLNKFFDELFPIPQNI